VVAKVSSLVARAEVEVSEDLAAAAAAAAVAAVAAAEVDLAVVLVAAVLVTLTARTLIRRVRLSHRSKLRKLRRPTGLLAALGRWALVVARCQAAARCP